MNRPQVNALRWVEFEVPSVARTAEFYETCWGLAPISHQDGAVYLRATGAEHHIVILREGPVARFARVGLAAPDTQTIDGLHERVLSAGSRVVSGPALLTSPGGGYGFSFEDLEGRAVSISAEVATHGDSEDVFDRPRKLSHCVMNSAQVEQSSRYYEEVLGFQLSDRTVMMDFIRCNADHHSVAFAKSGPDGLNHVAYEMPSHDALMWGAGRMKEAGFAVEWGIGRHGPGNNVFGYFIEPDGFVVEYTAEVEQVGKDYKVGMPEDWKRPDNRMDRWGFADPPSPRLRAAMSGDLQPT